MEITTIEIYVPARDKIKKHVIGTKLNMRDLISEIVDSASQKDIEKAVKSATKKLEENAGKR